MTQERPISEVDYVSVSGHAIERFRERVQSGAATRDIRRLLCGICFSGIPLGGQCHGEILIQSSLEEDMVVAVRPTKHISKRGGRVWVVKTILSRGQALANLQANVLKKVDATRSTIKINRRKQNERNTHEGG